MITRALVAGGGGFIGGHLVQRLAADGLRVTVVDSKPLPQWRQVHPEALNIRADLMNLTSCKNLAADADIIYHLAADVGGVGYIMGHHWQCASSVQITQNLLSAALSTGTQCFFFASSACIYPRHLQATNIGMPLREDMALPADPEGGYGWAKLYSERLCEYAACSGLEVRIARLFNVYGPHCDTIDARAKAPAALCYKYASTKRMGTPEIEVWGDGTQIRSFLYIDDCLEAIQSIVQSSYRDPINIASDEIVSISALIDILAEISQVSPRCFFMPDMPRGVDVRIPCLDLARKELGWTHKTSLQQGLRSTFEWILHNVPS